MLSLKEDKSLKREIMDKFSENIEVIIRGQVMNSFTGLRNSILSKDHFLIIKLVLLKELKEKCLNINFVNEDTDSEALKKEIYSLLNIFKNRFYVNICDTLVELKVFFLKNITFRPSFPQVTQCSRATLCSYPFFMDSMSKF